MYKYIIYCSVSAAIIIACKYLYQHWIRQNHTISNLKQELGILNDKVKRLENELERNKNSISGGIKIPIVFKAIESRPLSPLPSPKIIQLVKDTSVSSRGSRGSRGSIGSRSLVLDKPVDEPQNEHIDQHIDETQNDEPKNDETQNEPMEEPQKPLYSKDLEQMTAALEKEVADNISLSEIKDVELESCDVTDKSDKSDKTKKNYKKKSILPEAKDYNNGDRVTDENGVEYICVVGKRGGHSWKKL